MYPTLIRNIPGSEEEERQQNWRRRLGRVQLLCPKCWSWFTLGKDFKFDDDGLCNTSVYHICDDESNSWVVWPKLEGWAK